MSAPDPRAALARLEQALAAIALPPDTRRALEELRAALPRDLPREIERKYLLARAPLLPPGLEVEELEIEQGWLPGERLRERLRRVHGPRGERFERALKVGLGLERIEVEEPLDAADFARLWPATAGCRVHKRRTRVAAGAHRWEIDAFLDRPLWLAEVELADAAQRPDPPAWLSACIVREVTDEPGFTNLALARSGSGVPG
jgi:CYTH domain-containing protein